MTEGEACNVLQLQMDEDDYDENIPSESNVISPPKKRRSEQENIPVKRGPGRPRGSGVKVRGGRGGRGGRSKTVSVRGGQTGLTQYLGPLFD